MPTVRSRRVKKFLVFALPGSLDGLDFGQVAVTLQEQRTVLAFEIVNLPAQILHIEECTLVI